MQICYLVGAGPAEQPIAPRAGDYVIAADGGCDHLRRWGVAPDYVVGDMDSLQGELPECVPCRRAPAQKDESDMELALQEGLARGYRRFVFVGAAGGRPDHAFANLQLLVKAARLGAYATLHEGGWSCTALCAMEPGAKLTLKGRGAVSVFAYGSAGGVTIAGMQYELQKEDLDGASPRGLSNELDGEGYVSLETGALLCFWEDADMEAFMNV